MFDPAHRSGATPLGWLKTLGIFVRASFLSPEVCGGLTGRMVATPGKPATVYARDGRVSINEHHRRALSIDVPDELGLPVDRALDGLRGELEQHFGIALGERELTEYLVYGPGAFFHAHRDRRPTPGLEASGRQVSLVVFLNAQRTGTAGAYAGGDLRFYRLIDEPQWREVGFACTPEVGLLLAFTSDVMHEVTPVIEGQRCTLVTWFA